MGFLSEIRDHYSTLDHSLRRKERHVLSQAAEIIVPKRDRKNVKDLADFVDRFAGMIATDAPNTDVAPRFSHITAEPLFTAKKHPTPYNLYAAAAVPLGFFPWGRNHEDLPNEWKAQIGGTVRNTGYGENPHYQYVPPGATQPHPRLRNDVTMEPEFSHINMLEHTVPGIPSAVLHDLMAPLNNRYEQHGIPIDAGPINVKVAGSVLLGNLRAKEGETRRYTDDTERISVNLLRRQVDAFKQVVENADQNPARASSYAQGIRQQLAENHASPRAYLNSLKAFETWMKNERGGGDPEFSLPSEFKGDEAKHWMNLIGDAGEWNQRTSGISVPGRPRLETDPNVHGSLYAHEHTAAGMHTAEEWNQMSHDDRIRAAERVRDELPARWGDYQNLRRYAREEYDRSRSPGAFSFLSGTQQQNVLQDYRRGHPLDSSINADESLADLGLVEPADLSLGQNTRPSLSEITREAEGIGRLRPGSDPTDDANAINSGTRLQSSFEDFVAEREQAARHARAGVGEEGWRSMRPEERDSLIRAQMDQNRRSSEHSNRQRNVDAFEGLAEPDDITSRAIRMSSADPDYYRWTDQERRADARRIRSRLAHEENPDSNVVRPESASFPFEEARRAHSPEEWERMNEAERRASVARARIGLPYRQADYEHRREEARRHDPRFSPEEFDNLSSARQRQRTARFFAARRRESER